VRSFVVLIAIKFNGIRQTLELFLQFFDYMSANASSQQSAAIDYSMQEASKRRIVVAFAGCARPTVRTSPAKKAGPSFQSMGVENGSTGSMAFLGRLFREL
jgi:hypothetical protein